MIIKITLMLAASTRKVSLCAANHRICATFGPVSDRTQVGSTIPIAIRRNAVMDGIKKYSPPLHSTKVLSLLMI